MFSSSRNAANKWGWWEPTVTGEPFTSKPTRDAVSPMGLPYTYWVSVLLFVKAKPSIKNGAALLRDRAVDLRPAVTVKIEQGVLVLVTPIEVASSRD